mgnify:CR=1 FL=1
MQESCRKEGTCYKIECSLCDQNEEGTKSWYIGETSRSTQERLKEHMWLFSNKKEGDPSKNEASSVLWIHSRDEHGGRMREEDWQSSILSTLTKALNRQITEAVLISEKGGGGRTVRLLNSKQEFGANHMLEVVVMRGNEVLGKRNTKRKQEEQARGEEVEEEERGPAEGQGGPPIGGGEEAQTTTTPHHPRGGEERRRVLPLGVEGWRGLQNPLLTTQAGQQKILRKR